MGAEDDRLRMARKHTEVIDVECMMKGYGY